MIVEVPEVIEVVSEAVDLKDDLSDIELPEPPKPVRQPVPAPVEVPAEEVFLPFYRVEERPEFVTRALLRYPAQASRQRIEGVVIVEADIDARGRIVDTRIVREAGFGFEEAAIEMLMGSVFSPAIIGGRPVAVRMRFTIEFRLN